MDLVGAACADDGAGDAGLGQDPLDGGVGETLALGAEVIGEDADLVELGFVPVAGLVALGGVAELEAGAVAEVFGVLVFAGEETAGERVVGDDADALILAEGEQVGLDVAPEDVVSGLIAVEADEAAALAFAECEGELPGAVVGCAGVADLAPALEVVKRLEGFVDRRLRRRAVQLVRGRYGRRRGAGGRRRRRRGCAGGMRRGGWGRGRSGRRTWWRG